MQLRVSSIVTIADGKALLKMGMGTVPRSKVKSRPFTITKTRTENFYINQFGSFPNHFANAVRMGMVTGYGI